MKRCMYCGNENDDSSQNCSKCGNKLLDLPPQQSMMAEEVPEEEASLLQETENETQDIQISEDSLENAAFQPEIGREEEPAQEESAESQAEEEYEQDEEAFGGAEGYQQQYGGRDYFQGYPGETNVQQQYGGQAYGYEQQPQQYGYGAEEEQENYDYGQTRQPVSGNGPLMTAARKAVRSPLFFLAILFQTVMVGASVLNLVLGDVIASMNAMQATAQAVLGSSMAIRFMNGIIDLVEGASSTAIVGVHAAICIPGILLCAALWMIFFQTSPSRKHISTSGLSMAKGTVILKFVGICLLLIGGLLVSVAFVVAAGAAASTVSIIVGVILLILLILISVLVILFYVQLLHAIKVIRYNVESGERRGRISSYVPAMGILLCVFTILCMLPMAPDDYFALASRGASAAWLLFASLWLIRYRKKTR